MPHRCEWGRWRQTRAAASPHHELSVSLPRQLTGHERSLETQRAAQIRWIIIIVTHTHTHTHTHTFVSWYVTKTCPERDTHTHTHSHTHPYTHTHTHPQTHPLTHTHTHTLTHRHTNTYTHTHTPTHTHTHTHTPTDTHTPTHTHRHRHTHSLSRTHSHTPQHTHPHTHTHTQTHTHTHKKALFSLVFDLVSVFLALSVFLTLDCFFVWWSFAACLDYCLCFWITLLPCPLVSVCWCLTSACTTTLILQFFSVANKHCSIPKPHFQNSSHTSMNVGQTVKSHLQNSLRPT